jgi:hypothetical protein
MDLDVGEEHSFAVQRSMNGALWQLNDLVDPEVSADATAADQLESSICTAVYDLGNLAASPGTRMGSFLPSTARFVEACELGGSGRRPRRRRQGERQRDRRLQDPPAGRGRAQLPCSPRGVLHGGLPRPPLPRQPLRRRPRPSHRGVLPRHGARGAEPLRRHGEQPAGLLPGARRAPHNARGDS